MGRWREQFVPKLGPGQQVVMKCLKPIGHREGSPIAKPQRGMSLSWEFLYCLWIVGYWF